MSIGFLFWQVGGKIFLSVEAFNFVRALKTACYRASLSIINCHTILLYIGLPLSRLVSRYLMSNYGCHLAFCTFNNPGGMNFSEA
jgi:hypothetical protein